MVLSSLHFLYYFSHAVSSSPLRTTKTQQSATAVALTWLIPPCRLPVFRLSDRKYISPKQYSSTLVNTLFDTKLRSARINHCLDTILRSWKLCRMQEVYELSMQSSSSWSRRKVLVVRWWYRKRKMFSMWHYAHWSRIVYFCCSSKIPKVSWDEKNSLQVSGWFVTHMRSVKFTHTQCPTFIMILTLRTKLRKTSSFYGLCYRIPYSNNDDVVSSPY
jgi:hypothetical protein